MRELTEDEVASVAGGATAFWAGVANAAMAGATTATKPVTLEMGPVEVRTLYGPPTPTPTK